MKSYIHALIGLVLVLFGCFGLLVFYGYDFPQPLLLVDSSKTKPDSRKIPNFVDPHATILFSLETEHFYGDGKNFKLKDCYLGTTLLNCTFETNANAPHAYWYFIPRVGKDTKFYNKVHPRQVNFGYTMESHPNYPIMHSIETMHKFDILATSNPYSDGGSTSNSYLYLSLDEVMKPALPFEKKKKAIVFLQKNCKSANGRENIVKYLMENSEIPVESHGLCLNNVKRDGVPDKNFFSEYLFCITIENSVADGYVSEKLYGGLRNGCLPIIYGPTSVSHTWAPSSDSIIDIASFFDKPPTKEKDFPYFSESVVADVGPKLIRTLNLLANNKTEYEKYFLWKNYSKEQLNYNFVHATQDIGTYNSKTTASSIFGTPFCYACALMEKYRRKYFFPSVY